MPFHYQLSNFGIAQHSANPFRAHASQFGFAQPFKVNDSAAFISDLMTPPVLDLQVAYQNRRISKSCIGGGRNRKSSRVLNLRKRLVSLIYNKQMRCLIPLLLSRPNQLNVQTHCGYLVLARAKLNSNDSKWSDVTSPVQYLRKNMSYV